MLLGASGYTGRFTAEHITKHLPTDLKWAIAGRSSEKLTALAAQLKDINADRLQPGKPFMILFIYAKNYIFLSNYRLGIEVAELTHDDLHSLAAKAKVMVNMIGPYALYGEPVIDACVSNGTHYLDV